MRVLMVSPLPPPSGGIATWTQRYNQYCDQHGISVSIVNTAVLGKRAEKLTQRRSLFSEVKRTLGIVIDLLRELSKYKPDVVHINTNCNKLGIHRDTLCAWLVKRRKVALVVHCRCNIQDQLGDNVLAQRAFKRIVQLADVVLTLNTPSHEYVQNIFEGKSRIVPNFIEADRILPCKNISPVIRQVVFVGHVQDSKGAIEIIELAKLFPEVCFRLVGPVAKEVVDVQRSGNVCLLGEVEYQKVLACLDEADIFLFPTHTEGFANALLEAMARGLPIITTDVGANRDMLQDQGGIFVPVGVVDALADAINTIADLDIRKAMSQWNIARVKGKYTIDKVMQEFLNIYRECQK